MMMSCVVSQINHENVWNVASMHKYLMMLFLCTEGKRMEFKNKNVIMLIMLWLKLTFLQWSGDGFNMFRYHDFAMMLRCCQDVEKMLP